MFEIEVDWGTPLLLLLNGSLVDVLDCCVGVWAFCVSKSCKRVRASKTAWYIVIWLASVEANRVEGDEDELPRVNEGRKQGNQAMFSKALRLGESMRASS